MTRPPNNVELASLLFLKAVNCHGRIDFFFWFVFTAERKSGLVVEALKGRSMQTASSNPIRWRAGMNI